LGVHLASGRFVIEDLQIDGMQPGEPPWLVARRLDVSLTWRALFKREILLDTIEMTDWRMVVESFPDGRQTFPRLTGPPRAPRQGPGLVVTTLQYVHAHRGELVVNDYGSDWFMVAPNVDVTVSKAGQYRGRMRFNDGTIRIQKYVPMSADLVASFKLDSGKLVFDRIGLETDGAVSTMSGVVDMAKWPEQMYQVKSHIQFPRMRELFFANDKFSLFGEGDFTSALAASTTTAFRIWPARWCGCAIAWRSRMRPRTSRAARRRFTTRWRRSASPACGRGRNSKPTTPTST
jgi:hypothetical protein